VLRESNATAVADVGLPAFMSNYTASDNYVAVLAATSHECVFVHASVGASGAALSLDGGAH
jgi:hypothetical protein